MLILCRSELGFQGFLGSQPSSWPCCLPLTFSAVLFAVLTLRAFPPTLVSPSRIPVACHGMDSPGGSQQEFWWNLHQARLEGDSGVSLPCIPRRGALTPAISPEPAKGHFHHHLSIFIYFVIIYNYSAIFIIIYLSIFTIIYNF